MKIDEDDGPAVFGVLLLAVVIGLSIWARDSSKPVPKPESLGSASRIDRLERKLDEIHRVVCGERK